MNLVSLCIKIFFARIADVSIGTVRTMFIVKGNKLVATTLAFFELFIWFFAAREALNTNLHTIWIVIAYAGGYAMGTYIGTFLNEVFVSGIYHIQVISQKINEQHIKAIKDKDFGVTFLRTEDNKMMLFLEINKKRYNECLSLIMHFDPQAFIIITESKLVHNGYIKNKKSS